MHRIDNNDKVKEKCDKKREAVYMNAWLSTNTYAGKNEKGEKV